MTVNLRKARDFVYTNGVLWERALFAYLFENGDIDHLHRCILTYKNADGGFGHALEHDVRCPDSHPLALEYLLGVMVRYKIPISNIFDGTVEWLESVQAEDGLLRNPAALLDYPRAPWWNGGGQNMPDSIVGNLTALGLLDDSPAAIKVKTDTREWVKRNLTLEQLKQIDWQFMMYHAYDYYMNVDDFPDIETFRKATINAIVDLSVPMPENQYYGVFTFAPSPDSPVAKALPDDFLQAVLRYIEQHQQEDGGWNDQHSLPQWRAGVTISNLMFLRAYDRLSTM